MRKSYVFLPPTGKATLPGPDPKLFPTNIEGAYQILLRIEASDDREGNSDLAAIGVGPDIVQSAAAAGFPMPALRYFVGHAPSPPTAAIVLMPPAAQASVSAYHPLVFSWASVSGAAVYQLEIEDQAQQQALVALLQPTLLSYRAPSWWKDKVGAQARWRVVALNQNGGILSASEWRQFSVLQPAASSPLKR